MSTKKTIAPGVRLEIKRKGHAPVEVQIKKKRPLLVRKAINIGKGSTAGAAAAVASNALLRAITKGKQGLPTGTAAMMGATSGGVSGLFKSATMYAFLDELEKINEAS